MRFPSSVLNVTADTDESDSLFNSHRQDLKRKVHYARGGDPDFLSNPQPYKKRIEHAGYSRNILQRNPPRYDPDGDVVELEDEYEEEDDLEVVEENPYADIALERTYSPGTTNSASNMLQTSSHL